MESLINECQEIEFPIMTGLKSISKKVCLTPFHNKVMKWDTSNGQREGLTGTEMVTPEFLLRVSEISNDLQIDPDDLMAVMAFESGFDPDATNPDGAYGLI